MKGRNRASTGEVTRKSTPTPGEACVFVSHGMADADREAARRVTELLMGWGLDVYFEGGAEPATGGAGGDSAGILKSLDRGLSECTHLLCVLSARTTGAWWVPYQLGTAQAHKKRMAVLLLSDVTSCPEYLQLAKILYDLEDLATWTNGLPGGERMSQWMKMQQIGEGLADILPPFRVGLPRLVPTS